MRGARRYSRDSSRWARIIPAYAGSTTRKTLFSIGLWDHPRVCGEHPQQRQKAQSYPGSSPRMRGALRYPLPPARSQGIIPAYAGSTTRGIHGTNSAKDHPRVCGEHWSYVDDNGVGLGSSPRMRGAPHCRRSERAAPGIIPAYAGSTPWRFCPP